MTSVKAFRVDRPADGGLGRGRFYFTDAYSVFDWGPMPDAIPGKGASLCAMGAATFEDLEAAGVPTHYRGVISREESTPPGGDGPATDALSAHESGSVVPAGDEGGAGPGDEAPDPVALSAVDEPPVEMAIDLATVPELPHDGRSYDYEAYHDGAGSAALVPLEIVFRNVVPVGSSLRGRTTPADHGLDLADWPASAVELPEPIVEFSTKLEDGDRYLDREEADRIAGPADLDELEAVARQVDAVITERAASAGFAHQDGKIECIVVDGEVRVADVAGTFDENRFAYDGVQVSKEVLRQHYRRTQPDWVDAVYAAKESAREADDPDWKARCDRTPDPLPGDVVALASDLYCGGANAYLDRDLFDAPPIADAVERVRAL